MRKTDRQHGRLLAALGLTCLSGSALALDWGLEARAGAVHSDNVAQAPAGPLVDSAAIGVLELGGVIEHSTRSLLLDAEANRSFRYFFSEDYPTEQQSQLRGTVEWMPIRNILRLRVSDTYGQLALNPAEGLLPSEYENANVLTAGPTLTISLGQDTRLVAEGEYRTASFADSPIDTERRFGQLSMEHALSRLFTVYAAGSKAAVDFDIAGASRGYDVATAEFGFDGVGRRTALNMRAGINRLEFGGDKFDGTTYQLDLERRMSRRTRVFLNARREVTDAAEVFQLGQVTDPALTSIRDVQITSQPMLRTQYRAAWVWSGNRVDLNAQAGFISEKFDAVPQDPLLTSGINRIVREYGIGTTYRFRGGSTFGAGVEMLREHFRNGQRSNDLFGTLTYTQSLTDKLGLEVRAQRIRRTDSPRDFLETRLFAFVRYVLHEPRQRQQAAFDRGFERNTQRSRTPAQRSTPAGEAEE